MIAKPGLWRGRWSPGHRFRVVPTGMGCAQTDCRLPSRVLRSNIPVGGMAGSVAWRAISSPRRGQGIASWFRLLRKNHLGSLRWSIAMRRLRSRRRLHARHWSRSWLATYRSGWTGTFRRRGLPKSCRRWDDRACQDSHLQCEPSLHPSGADGGRYRLQKGSCLPVCIYGRS
jgi:hypothetical protein